MDYLSLRLPTAENFQAFVPVCSCAPPGWSVNIKIIGLMLVYVTDRADVDTKDEKNQK